MDRREEDFEIPWPSFVDILSSVIIMFIFFILVIIIIMSIMTVKKQIDLESQHDAAVQAEAQKMMEQSESQSQSESTSESQSQSESQAQEKIEELEQTIAELQQAMSQMEQQQQQEETENNSEAVEEDVSITDVRTKLTESKTQKIEVNSSLDESTIYYDRGAITVSDDTTAAIEEMIQTFQKGRELTEITLSVADNPHTLSQSQSREQSLSRALNLRNTFIDQGVPPEIIKIKYVPAEEKEYGYDWVHVNLK